MSRGLLGRNSPLHIRQKRREALKDADVVILAGIISLICSTGLHHSFCFCIVYFVCAVFDFI